MIDRGFLSRMLAEPFLTDIERELATSHLEALDEVARLKKMLTSVHSALVSMEAGDLDSALEAVGEIMKLTVQ